MNLAADFMDGKHIAIVGGSWALHPRIAGRKSLYVLRFLLVDSPQLTHASSLNWWQKKYLWPWVTFRLVRDTQRPNT